MVEGADIRRVEDSPQDAVDTPFLVGPPRGLHAGPWINIVDYGKRIPYMAYIKVR